MFYIYDGMTNDNTGHTLVSSYNYTSKKLERILSLTREKIIK